MLGALAIILTGCSQGQSGALNEPQNFAAYAETVFRRQNNVTSHIMLLTLDDVGKPDVFDHLLAAEKTMQQACADLIAYAQASQTESNTNLLQRIRAGKAINACAQATDHLENLLKDIKEI